jgi:hypothetical protein
MLAYADTFPLCKPYSLYSVHCGSQWALAQLVEWIQLQPDVQDDKATIKTHVDEFWNDTLKDRTPVPIYRETIDFREEWTEIKQRQMRHGQEAVKKFLDTESAISAVIVSGAGARDTDLSKGLLQAAEPSLDEGLSPVLLLPPSLE